MDRNPTETARKTAEQALSRLAAELEAGRSEALTNHLAAMSRFRRYSWQNVLLISAQRPNVTNVAGIHAWNDLGRRVKKGEKGIVIFAPGAAKQESTRSQAPPNDPFRLVGVRATYVFDVSQTEGKPVPEFRQATGNPRKYGEQLKAWAAKRGIELKFDRSIAPAQGISGGGEIRLMPGLPPAQELSVLTRELTHEMLHHRKDATALSHELRETQAELVSYVVTRGLGLEPNSAAADSVARCNGDKKILAESLRVVQETSAQILDELLPEERISPGNIPSVHQERPFLDAEGFGRLHSEYGNRLIQSITGLVRDRDKAEDIAARAFQVAWAKREQFRGEALPQTWIHAIARNEARQSWGRERIAQFDSMDREDSREIAAPGLVTDELEKQDDLFRLRKALEQVPVKYRRALISHFVDGLSTREIARREGIPVGTVLSRIHTGKQLLRDAWEAPLRGPHAGGIAAGTLSAMAQERQPRLPPEHGGDPQLSIESPEPASWGR